MPRARRLHRCLLPVLAGAALLAPTASAETYGELGRFGSAGTGHGSFKFTGPPASSTTGTHAFGVDPGDDTIYVGDEPQKRQYRIQKLTAGGQFLAETPLLAPANRDGIEGIAVDPVEKRIYMLALERRSESAKIDPSQAAAGTLYAFSTERSGEALVPAPGTSSEGVLVDSIAFEAQSDAPEKALLKPAGIAVDPVTHDVIVLGEVEQAPPKEGEEPQPRVALQRVHADGTFGERYVDRADFFASEATPNSPVVSPHGAVYVAIDQQQTDPLGGSQFDELAQIPSDFSSIAPPTPFVKFTMSGGFTGEGHPVVEFDENEPASKGGGLSIAPDGLGGEGTIYTRAHVFLRTGQSGASYPGLLAFNGASGSEIGWTGGQTKNAGTGCAIPIGEPSYDLIAAGRERNIFVLDPATAQIIAFGPEGKGCPAAEGGSPSATVNGQPLSPSETVAPGTPVTFSSTMTQANALSVEWNFGDGVSVTESADEHQHIEVTHAFVRGGELTVTETIHTDDLATPTIVEQAEVSVSNTAVAPTALLEGPLEVTLGGGVAAQHLVYLEGGGLGLTPLAGGEATFDGSASFDSNPPGSNAITAYHWVFGDGSSETTGTATVAYDYRAVGVYKVELTVTDALGLTSAPSTLTVKVVAAPTPPPQAVGQATVTPPARGRPPLGLTTLPAPTTSNPVPATGLVSTRIAASASGIVRLVVTCPAGETRCAGTVTLRTLTAVADARSSGSRTRPKAVLTLAAGQFALAGGHLKVLTLRLRARARSLLARAHKLLVRAVFVAHDPAGATHTTSMTVVLHTGRDDVKK